MLRAADTFEAQLCNMQHYTDGALRTIGEQCAGKLPPASAVQAMFMYEMQRQSEAEALFKGMMFELARVQEASTAQETRLVQFQDGIAALKKQMAVKDVEERLATSKTRSDVLQTKVKQQDARIDGQGERLVTVETKQEVTDGKLDHLAQQLSERVTLVVPPSLTTDTNQPQQLRDAIQDRAKLDKLHDLVTQIVVKVKAMHKESKTTATQLTEAMSTVKEVERIQTELETVKTNASTCDGDLGILFDERDALAAQLQQATDRISKLEDLVRALTAQQSPATSNGSSPSLYQILPVHTNDGQPLELRVPKGHSFRGSSPPRTKKENSPPRKGDIRSFTPGHQWS